MSRSDDGKGEVWSKRFERFSSSGLAVTRFCAVEQVSVASFYYWRKKFGQADPPRSTRRMPGGSQQATRPPSAFRPISVVPATPNVAIHLPCGIRIEVRAEDVGAIRTVIAEVTRADAAAVESGRGELASSDVAMPTGTVSC